MDNMSWKELHLSQNNHLLPKVRQSIVWFQMSFQKNPLKIKGKKLD